MWQMWQIKTALTNFSSLNNLFFCVYIVYNPHRECMEQVEQVKTAVTNFTSLKDLIF